MPITDDEIERFGFLKTLDADESLAVFLSSLGHALADSGQSRGAVRIYQIASSLDEDNAMYGGFAAQVMGRAGLLGQQFGRTGHRRGMDPLAEHRRIQEMNRQMRDRVNPHRFTDAPVP
jgi:hypothetical protein